MIEYFGAIPCGKIKLPLSSNWNAFSYLNALCSRDLHTAQSNGTTGSGAWIPALFCFPSQIKINSTSNYNCQWNNFSITKKFQKFLSQFHRITIYKNNKPNANESCYFLGHWIDRFFRFKRRYWLHRDSLTNILKLSPTLTCQHHNVTNITVTPVFDKLNSCVIISSRNVGLVIFGHSSAQLLKNPMLSIFFEPFLIRLFQKSNSEHTLRMSMWELRMTMASRSSYKSTRR